MSPLKENARFAEHMYFNSTPDVHVAEIYFINKYKPIYNTVDKMTGDFTLKMDFKSNWKPYEGKLPWGHIKEKTYKDSVATLSVWRERKRISQEGLASVANVSIRTIWTYEHKGFSSANVHTLVDILVALDIDMEQLDLELDKEEK